MIPFPLFLNELSLSIQNHHEKKKLEAVLGFVDTLKAAKQRRPDIELHNSLSLYECDIGNGDYLFTILKGNNYVDHWRFIRSLAQKAPWDISGLTVNVQFKEQDATGIALALENRSATISLSSDDVWKNSEIRVSVAGTEGIVPNLAIPEHVIHWNEMLRDFGVHVSTSSVVFQDGAIQMHMFLRDHNPPHLHFQYSGCWAVINIHTFDIMEGHPPSHVSSYIARWTRQYQQELIQNWERCCDGVHPLLISQQ